MRFATEQGLPAIRQALTNDALWDWNTMSPTERLVATPGARR
jgi:hypothetical protein